MKINKVLVHGDFHPRNILVDGENVATFDLEEAHLGDPAFDIGILLGSYLLRAEYHQKVRKKLIKAVIEMINKFFESINIPENKFSLEQRFKRHAGGLMLWRIDGLSANWTRWFKREGAKRTIRKLATALILDESTPFSELVKEFYS